MKSKKLLVLAAAGLLGIASLAACNQKNSSSSSLPSSSALPSSEPSSSSEPSVAPSSSSSSAAPSSSSSSAAPSSSSSSAAPSSSSSSAAPSSSSDSSSSSSVEPLPVEPEKANGVYTYVNDPGSERVKILGLLEKYAVDNKLTGLTIFNNGGYVIYNDAVQKGTNNYIPGYGFGIAGDGDITADLDAESNAAWKRYYHTYLSEDPQYLNYMNDQGSVVGDLIGMVNASYFTTRMNRTKDGYDWVGELAKVDRPEAVNADATTGLATKYRFPVKVGSELKYTTLSTKYASFNNREVALEDYITPYKIYYTKKYGMVRGSENLSGAGSIKGSSSYYNSSAKGFNQEKWDKLGIKAYEEGGKSYLEFEFNLPCNPFFAMTYVSSSMFAPVPEAFIKAIGGDDFEKGIENWGANSSDKTETILDHWLSTGPFTLEKWDEDQQIVFKANTNFEHAANRYKIGGYHYNILKAINTDPEAAWKEFQAGKLHSCGVPYTKLTEAKSDSRTTTTIGDSNFKLNMNTCTQEVWNELFGENGSVSKLGSGTAWECEPAMANKDFVSGISFAIDRQSLAAKVGRQAAFEYFAPTYLIDPENGVVYNDTDEHKEAVKSLQEGTDGFGYSLELAKAAFKKAAEDLIDEGVYSTGDTIHIEIAWQTPADEEEYHNVIAKNLTDAFNTDDNPLKLAVDFQVGASWSDVYYKKMMKGQFDIGFGSIGGSDYNPIEAMHVLSTDPEIGKGYTLSWGLDTNDADNGIVYDDKIWSFDALYMAGCEGVYAKDGKNSNVEYDYGNFDAYRDLDGSFVFEGDFYEAEIADDAGDVLVEQQVSNLNLYGYYNVQLNDAGTAIKSYDTLDLPIVRDDFVISVPEDEEAAAAGYTHIKVVFPEDVAALFDDALAAYMASNGYFMVDIYFSKTVFGLEGSPSCLGSAYILSGMPALPEEGATEPNHVPDDGWYY